MLTRVPPVAVPIRARDLMRAARELRTGDCGARFRAALGERTGARAVALFSSGRAALAAGLSELARGSDRREVVIPAYGCYTVPAAVVRAGLRVRLCDVSPATLDLEPEALRAALTPHTLAVVAIHPLGLPAAVARISRLAHEAGALVIEDSAQLLGAEVGDGLAGSLGDLALFSFGRGKPITTLGGGALTTPREEFAELVTAAGRRPRGSVGGGVRKLTEAAIYSLLSHPTGFRLAEALPGLEVGATRFDPAFGVGGLGEGAAALGLALLARVEEFNAARRARARALWEALDGLPGISAVRAAGPGQPAPLRVALRVRPGLRDELLRALRAAGIGATRMYPASLAEVAEIAPHLAPAPARCPGAAEVARSLLTLPCYPGLADSAIKRMRAVTDGVVAASRAVPRECQWPETGP